MIELEIPPVGIKLLTKEQEYPEKIPIYNGISYCDAVRQASEGAKYIVTKGSIQACQWSPVVLGLKQPENSFEQSIQPKFSSELEGLFLAPLTAYDTDNPPDIVIIRTLPVHFRWMIEKLGRENFLHNPYLTMDKSALVHFDEGREGKPNAWIRIINRWLDRLNRFPRWRRFTLFLFKSTFITHIFDKFISRTMADMSMCRNSTYLPYETDKANISYFCTGGIAWGRNSSLNMTAGFPFPLFQRLQEEITIIQPQS